MTSTLSPTPSTPTSGNTVARPGAWSLPLDRPQALAVYRQLILARRAEEAIREEYHKDEMKTPVHLGIGQEAIPVGVCWCLPGPQSKAFGTYRNHALYLAKTQDADGFFAELYGRATGSAKGKAGSMHLSAPDAGLIATSAVVATTIPVAVGAALANRYAGRDEVVTVFFGDGAVEEGVFWESLNFACVQQLPVVFVCEDNNLAIHATAVERQGFRSIPEALQGFRCQMATGDGTDVLEVIRLTRELLERMSAHGGPGVLHLRYFRFLEHVGIREDFDAGYRRRPSADEARAADPVMRLRGRLREQGVGEAELHAMQAAVDEQIQRSLEAARRAPFAVPAELERDVLA